MNVAMNKKILENNWKNSEILTNGEITGYTGFEGFSSAYWPTYLTLDLENEFLIKTIRFLLWDNKGNSKNTRANRIYHYRLLVSKDNCTWTTIYDTIDKGYNGWQEFIFESGILCRFIRLHCIYGSANNYFHIVEIQAFDDNTTRINEEITFSKTIISSVGLTNEIGDGLPIANQISSIVNELEVISEKYNLFNNENIKKLIESLKNKTNEVEKIERSLSAIQNLIIKPVNEQINYSNKIGKVSIYLGIIGGIIGLISIILSIFMNNILS